MDSDYDRKFEEMKNYIPFLDSMINRLESSSVPSNPRQAQLDKIRSLRDLLQDKKKRMKMENLLKCEQVLINLYKKVEQREIIQDVKSDSDVKSPKTPNLSHVRNKLKSVATKINTQDTLPEIARASETEEICVPGSKEPALFQRRPNLKSISPIKSPDSKAKEPSPQSSKRSYTRVLVSPDRSSKKWSDNDDTKSEKPLFSRRSPRRTPRDETTYHKKERKKVKKPKPSKDLNITLNVPQERLSSLSTDDILSRIINCSDSDVDITTLRELRTQILSELKHTGVKEDISDLLLKSYNTQNKDAKQDEIEEGELSDSESEAIESIYGNLVIMDKDKSSSTIKTSLGNDQSRKIQICLVINSDKATLAKNAVDNQQNKEIVDVSDFESFAIEKKRSNDEILPKNQTSLPDKVKHNELEKTIPVTKINKDDTKIENNNDSVNAHDLKKEIEDKRNESKIPNFYKPSKESIGDSTTSEVSKLSTDIITTSETNTKSKKVSCDSLESTNCADEQKVEKNATIGITDNSITSNIIPPSSETKKSNDGSESVVCQKNKISVEESTATMSFPQVPINDKLISPNKTQDSVEIPLINVSSTTKQEIVSEIDILQALKKEILGETSTSLDSDAETPLLHQPKITKVASAQEIVKNRISIENYKQKSNSATKTFFKSANKKTPTEDRTKKQSLKLTEKECERFNLPIKLPLNESSDDDDIGNSSISMDEIYGDLAPKSPDHDDFADTGIKPPVIIPSDPIKTTEVRSVADIDMRKPPSLLSNNMFGYKTSSDKKYNEDLNNDFEKPKVHLIDPRKNRWDSSNRDDKSTPYMSSENKLNINQNLHRNQSMAVSNNSTGPNKTSLIAPNMTPILMTPNSRSYEMTPSRNPFDNEDYSNRKHVYAPSFPNSNSFDNNMEPPQEFRQFDNINRNWDENQINSPRDVDYRNYNCDNFQNEPRQENYNSDSRDTFNRADGPHQPFVRFDSFGRLDCPPTPLPFGRLDGPPTPLPFGRLDCPSTPLPSFGRQDCPSTPLPSFGRQDCPSTPLPSFGRQDCPSTPLPSFGRQDCPSTPLPSFGRQDCPSTPLASFGRLECPGTPLPNFGRAEMPLTPVHPFGRSDGSATPVHSFGRNDYSSNYPTTNKNYGRNSDPRRNRNSEFDNYTRWEDDRVYRDRKFNSGYKSDQRSFCSSDSYNSFETNSSRNEMNRSRDSKNDRYFKDYPRDRDFRSGRSQSRDNEFNRNNSRDNRRGSRFSDSFQSSESKRKYQRGDSMSRDKSVDRNISNSQWRASSIGRSSQKENQLSVQQSTGRSFTIDTSINKTFQGFNKEHSDNFNARRQRASSVGRVIVRDSCRDSRSHDQDFQNTKSESFEKRRSRACSVGRDVSTQRLNNLKDIKADLRSFKLRNDLKVAKRNLHEVISGSKTTKNSTDKNKEYSDVNRKNQRSNSIEKYSPRKNYRDPRIRRESRFDNRDKSNKKERIQDSKGYGIVYSDDNISKGTILGPGCGVKNYKIPKIKRPPEETTVNEEPKEIKVIPTVKTSESEKVNEKYDNREVDNINIQTTKCKTINLKNKTDDAKNKNTETLSDDVSNGSAGEVQNADSNIIPEHSTRRITRSAKISPVVESLIDSPVKRTRRSKKPVIYDSESESEDKIKVEKVATIETDSICKTITEEKVNKTVSSKHKMASDGIEKKCNDDLNSSFGDIFSDTITCDPVLDNINALIADLDHDLDTSKNMCSQSQFTQEILLENMLENITTTDSTDEEKSTKLISDIVENEKISSPQIAVTENKEQNNTQSVNVFSCVSPKTKEDNLMNTDTTALNKLTEEKKKNENECTQKQMEITTCSSNETKLITGDSDKNEPVVSTTKEDVQEKILRDLKDKSAAPDSTINTDDLNKVLVEDTVPDSTNESNIDLTPSNSLSEFQNKDSAMVHSSQSIEGDTIGKFLSILQDSSRINEVLSFLSEKSSDKIKKKLEKLRDIVLNDDDDNGTDKITSECQETTLSLKDSTQNIDKEIASDSKLLPELSQNEHIKDTIDDTIKNTLESNYVHKVCDEEKNKNILSTIESQEKDNLEGKETEALDEAKYPKQSQVITKKKILKGNKKNRKRGLNKVQSGKLNRVTRSVVTSATKAKKTSRELLSLQADIREVFNNDDILGGTTGIRMCRLAKLVDETSQNSKDEVSKSEFEPVVRLEKFKNVDSNETVEKSMRKKNVKTKNKTLEIENKIASDKTKSRTTKSSSIEKDPYAFETDSFSESYTNEKRDESLSEYDSESAESTKSGNTESITEVKKKPKRRRRAWQAGVVPKNKKKKNQTSQSKQSNNTSSDKSSITEDTAKIPDLHCFTDKTYCFVRNLETYSCRLCDYEGGSIVYHYKKNHPHIEIPLSRMSSNIAMEAIKQCDKVNLQSISKLPSSRYICRFCFKEFSKHKNLLESFFWHIVSVHTGEYKENCSVCKDDAECPFDLDIPPPPVAQKGQLIGYICGICNYTQVSLENLKNHVINRHNDKQTEVFTINMSHMSTKMMNSLLKRVQSLNNTKTTDENPFVRRTRSNVSAELAEDKSDFADDSDGCDNASTSSSFKETKPKPDNYLSIKSKITFENDSDTDKVFHPTENIMNAVKLEPETSDNAAEFEDMSNLNPPQLADNGEIASTENEISIPSNDIFQLPHFKVNYTDSGVKEYVCCINNELHYKTVLLISFKKHVQMKHSEKWDGYCSICKVIVMPQGVHNFAKCLQHFIDAHFDNFPILEKNGSEKTTQPHEETKNSEATSSPKPFLSVRPLSELISKSVDKEYPTNPSPLPIIESVVSLGTVQEPNPLSYPRNDVIKDEPKTCLYEEAQAEIMSKKNRIVLDAMMKHEKLVHVFKCAGRFCSYSTDSAEDALLHASTHTRVGGDNALKCSYCDYDTSDNAIELITHVFKTHGYCQYVCGFCFYRAAASQLVNAHISRVHGDARVRTVLKTAFSTEPDNEKMPLSRADAVPFYNCCHDEDTEQACKFKTYTPGKFCEHITNKHPNNTVHKCFICQGTSQSVSELIQHLKTHGLKLYQCVWCVFGADNESELLFHASNKHPAQQPQAYLRVITNKEGTTEYRVLPLAHLNKSKVTTIDIPLSNLRENPVKEAEMSVDLEKLIGHTTNFIDSMATITSGPSESSTGIENQDTGISCELEPSTSFEPRSATPIIQVPEIQEKETPIIKTEILKSTLEKSALNTSDVIVCLDSDEEDENPPNNTSIEKVSTNASQPRTEIKMPKQLLFLCSKCLFISKNARLFRSHLVSCFPSSAIEVPCAYCPFKSSKTIMVRHYTSDHLLKSGNVQFHCFKCPEAFTSLVHAKDHLMNQHNISTCDVTTNHVNGQPVCIVGDNVTKTVVRRKRSMGSGDKVEGPPAKTKKFGPQDIDQLPINPIFDYSVYCSLCEFSTKVRLNMVRHLQLHANQQPVPQTAPVNPVPHLETNEKHFDKMVNLASSSLTVRSMDKTNKNDNPTVTVLLPPAEAARYPKYVPERQRNTCGAKGCAYISLDENMLKYHWEALHSGSTSFHCVHCPPNQTLDTTMPLTASRIIAHLKMHDVRLYACSQCSYYHHKRQVVEKHAQDIHKVGNIMVVREEISNPPMILPPPVVPTPPAPTMDLKPWQCGLCEFKSLLRPEVIEHCAKNHQSKMQFKCAYCAFRTSNMENITKHQSLSHHGKLAETFYYYYREGTLPNADGIPYWQMQRKKFNLPETRVKTEKTEATPSATTSLLQNPSVPTVDLNIVKKEVTEPLEETIEDLCKHFGQFCEPNGLKYKCSLCKNVIEDTKEAMQSHLYEELKYRKWGCSICMYKAFHKRGLSEHMKAEHRQNRDPVELQVDTRVETWVAKLLDYQESMIAQNKEKLAQQKIEILKQPATSVTSSKSDTVPAKPSTPTPEKVSMEELEKKFGPLGAPVNLAFCCPKCKDVIPEESIMRDHLESELNKIRWCCSACPLTFQSYHQAQFHCKTHTGLSSRPIEAPRDTILRTSWVNAVLEKQKSLINKDTTPTAASMDKTYDNQSNSPEPDNSLLVVRYEERVPTPDVESANRSTSEDEKLYMDEPLKNRKRRALTCDYCTYSTTSDKFLKDHKLRHYGLQPSTCAYCKLTGSLKTLAKHQKIYHSTQPPHIIATELPNVDPHNWLRDLKNRNKYNVVICLPCQSPLIETDAESHVHEGLEPEFSKFGDVIVRCTTCSSFHKDVNKFSIHNQAKHPNDGNYVFYKLSQNKLPQFGCSNCPQKFTLKKDLKAHIDSSHFGEVAKETIETLATTSVQENVILLDDEEDTSSLEKAQPPSRKVARKSTTKLPNIRAVARKSTTKLPFTDTLEGYSHYGRKPSTDDLDNVTTLMPFYNTLMPFTYNKLKEVLNISPAVMIKKLNDTVPE